MPISKLPVLKAMTIFVTQNDGKKAPQYCRVSVMKNGIATPRIINPPSFAIAIPSTLFDERETMSSEIITPIGEVNVAKATAINMSVSVREKKISIIAENAADITAGKPSRDNKYPVFPTGVTDK